MRKDNEAIEINFHKSLYPPKAIKNAIEVYKEVAKFSLKKEKRYIKVSISDVDRDLRSFIKDEFCNYVLFLIRAIL